jgi:hypothetical protein
MEVKEAQLFRMLTAVFGEDQVIFGMSALAVSGGEVPESFPDEKEVRSRDELSGWARSTRCLFTVVDYGQNPRLVVDFSASSGEAIDLSLLESQAALPYFLQASGVKLVLLTTKDFQEILDPNSSLTLPKFLNLYLEIDE